MNTNFCNYLLLALQVLEQNHCFFGYIKNQVFPTVTSQICHQYLKT